jgi:hypothetical protein
MEDYKIQTIKERIANLLSIKSLVTLITTITVNYLAIIGVISGQDLLTLYGIIIGFYFGVKSTNKE